MAAANPLVGRPANPWRAPEARYRRGRAHRLPADPEAALPAVSDLADVSRQPCPRPGLHRFLHGSHRRACASSSSSSCSPTTAARVLHFNVTEHPTAALDRPAARGGLPRRLRAVLSPPRSRRVYGHAFRHRVKGMGIREVADRARAAHGRIPSRSGSSARSGASVWIMVCHECRTEKGGNAAEEMRAGPSESGCRTRLQTPSRCVGQEPAW